MKMDNYFISDDKSLLNRNIISNLLKNQSWSKNIPIEYIDRLIEYSLCFGVYEKGTQKQIGFGRVISDYTTYAYMCDIVIEADHRRNGLATNLVRTIMKHPNLQGLKTWSLRTTKEARKIYENIGFKAAELPASILEVEDLTLYSQPGFINLHQK